MNRQRYRLVFSTLRGILVAVSECARSNGKKAGSTRLSSLTLAALCLSGNSTLASPPLADGTVPVAAPNFVSGGAATVTHEGHTLTIDQSTAKAVLNWNSFNISGDSSVVFHQPDVTSATLNRIGDINPSIIQGHLSANGSIYMINQNGILFDRGAQIDVNGLVASALNVSDDLFMRGLLSTTGVTPAFTWEGTAEQFSTTHVRVEDGARIHTSTGGRVMILAPKVENLGKIETPQGQTILAGGAKVYLAAPLDPNLRGFLVEVDPFTGNDANGNPVNLGGTVTNEQLGSKVGEIIAERGNVTLAALAVNQSGMVRVTSTVDQNGSIILKAQDTVIAQDVTIPSGERVSLPVSTRKGTLTFGSASITEALPDTSSTRTLLDDQNFSPSFIQGSGKLIDVRGTDADGHGAVIRAHGGKLSLTAQAGEVFQQGSSDARVYAGAGSQIDVSGEKNVSLAIERNIVSVELRGNELRDSPLQRNGFLRGKTVHVDIREGTPLADISAYAQQIQRGISEKSSVGGNIFLKSEGDVIVRQGATLDVSGGSLNYRTGDTGTSKLIAESGVYDISDARPDGNYTGLITDTSRIEAGYTEGKNAGTVQISAGKVALDGDLKGHTVTGIHQQLPGTQPLGGKLMLGEVDSSTGAVTGINAAVMITGNPVPLAASFDLNSVLPDTLTLGTSLFSQGGVNRLEIHTASKIELPADARLVTSPGGEITLDGKTLDVQGHIVSAGGKIKLATKENSSSANPSDYALIVGPHARISAAGLWINDITNPGNLAIINGGSVILDSAADLLLSAGSVVDVSGGGRQHTNSRTFGNAGQISLSTGRTGLSDGLRGTARMQLGGELRGYALSDGKTTGEGGKLAVSTSNVTIGGQATGQAGELHLTDTFFRSGGFRNFDINGTDGLTVAAGTHITAAPESRLISYVATTSTSGTAPDTFSTRQVLDGDLRNPGGIRLSADSKSVFGDVTIGRDAIITAEPGGSLDLFATHQITVDGTLRADGGQIRLQLPAPDTTNEAFQPERAIWLGEHSRLLASGYTRLTPSRDGLRHGQVRDGGHITIRSDKGYLVTQSGSLMDVSGTVSPLHLLGQSGYQLTPVTSAGGAITLAAREGMVLDGDMRASGGSGPTGHAPGGTLDVSLDRGNLTWVLVNPTLAAAVNSPRNLTLTQLHQAGTGSMVPGQALDTATYNGQAVVSAGKIEQAGFAGVALHAEDRIVLDGTVSLRADRSISLDAPNLAAQPGTTATLTAARVMLGNTSLNLQQDSKRRDASAGNAQLIVHARDIELAGNMALQGIGSTTLDSTGDIHLRAVDTNPTAGIVDYRGSLVTGGDLVMTAARIYPTTFSKFALEIYNNPSGSITINRTGTDAPVLSAAGQLAITAPHIHQNGVLKAPFGSIELKSETITRVTDTSGITLTRTPTPNGTVSFSAGSLTSVSGAGQIVPFGKTSLSGRDWLYTVGGDNVVITAPPEKNIVVKGDKVDMNPGARIDLAGGGNMLAWEFNPGPGGSKDVLDPRVSPDTYAILPSLQGPFAPFDEQAWQQSGLKSGDSIQILSGASGLPAGTYALLPARYALLPGAYMVTLKHTPDALPPVQQADSSWNLAAFRTSMTTDGSYVQPVRTETVNIAPGSLARTRSEYHDTLASTFFQKNPVLQQPGDAGRLSLDAGSLLRLKGDLDTTFVAAHRGAEIDISASKLAVTADGNNGPAGSVTLSVDDLNHLSAASLLLGGTRKTTTTASAITVGTIQLDINTGSGKTLASPEIILAATDTIHIHAGSIVAGEGTTSTTGKNLSVNGDGALVRASSGSQADLSRTGATRTAGQLLIDSGATIRGKSVIYDATMETRSQGQTILSGNGELLVGASRISVGDTTGVTDGLVFSNAQLTQLGNPQSLKLKSYSTLDLYGDAAVGNTGMKQLVIEAGGIGGYANAGKTATLTAANVYLVNTDNRSDTGSSNHSYGNGALEIHAGNTTFGSGYFSVKGFTTSRIEAAQEIRFEGTGQQQIDGDLTMATERMVAASDARQEMIVSGALNTAALPASGIPLPELQSGGQIAMEAARIVHGGRIDLPSGKVTLSATGPASTDNVVLAAGSMINTAGQSRLFSDTRVAAPGGQVKLDSKAGSVLMASGAGIDVSGSKGGNAGKLTVKASHGTFDAAGDITGKAETVTGKSTPQQGVLDLDVAVLNNFSQLNTILNTGEVSEARSLHIRTGNLAILSGDTVRSEHFTLTADGGRVDIDGVINASGSNKGGNISIHARDGVALHQDGKLQATALTGPATPSGTAGRGGHVELGTSSGQLELFASSEIEVSGAGAGSNGTVVLRAPRTGNGGTADVAMTPVATTFTGAADVIIEGVRVYEHVTELQNGTTSGTALGIDSVHADNSADFSAANTARMATRLGLASTPATRYHLRPGVEVRSDADLALTDRIDLHTLRYQDEPGTLTLRAPGDITINGALSDGFDSATSSGKLLPASQPGADSWSYRIVAGADTGSARPLTLQSADQLNGKGTITLAASTLIRTGTGSIAMAAGQDIDLSSGAAVYTAGNADDPGAFTTTVSGQRPEYSQSGGNISLDAARNIAGSGSEQWINNWLFRLGSTLQQDGTFKNTVSSVFRPSWWVRFSEFSKGVGALGGGDVQINAGGNIDNLGAVVADNGRLSGAAGSVPDATGLKLLGGGDLTLHAGGDINSSLFYTARGKNNIRAGGALGSSITDSQGNPVYTTLALGDSQISIQTGGHATLDSIFNPTMVAQSAKNMGPGTSRKTFFSGYSADNGVTVSSVTGDIRLVIDTDRTAARFGLSGNESFKPLSLLPGTLHLAASGGSITVDNPVSLAPAARGQLELFAAESITLNGSINLADTSPASLPSVLSPDNATVTRIDPAANGSSFGTNAHSNPPIHLGDTEPVRIIAVKGNITGAAGGTGVILPKRSIIQAGQDIVNFSLYGQNLDPTDVTRVMAGRDIIQETPRNGGSISINNAVFELGGPGRMEVIAGRNLDLGSSKGIVTRGNFNNPFLDDQGAQLFVQAGAVSGDYAALQALLLQPGQEKLRIVSGYDNAVTVFMRDHTNNPQLDATQAQTAFAALPAATQRLLLIDIFYATLRNAGRAAITEGKQAYQPGYDAIQAVFPGSTKNSATPYNGSINLFFSQIKTEQGGGIDMMAPGGGVNAGLANAEGLDKKPSELGIVTAGGGDIRSFARDSFAVNQSRVFTLRGGDIMLWSSYGDIDAGKGAKTASATPPPQVVVRGDQIILDTSNSVAGSGIATLMGKDGAIAANVDLIAPEGIVDAGDAGIRSTGNVAIAAARTLNVDNIQAGGSTSGVSQTTSVSIAGGFSGSSADADSGKTGQQAGSADSQARNKRNSSLFTVEILGLGDEENERRKKRKGGGIAVSPDSNPGSNTTSQVTDTTPARPAPVGRRKPVGEKISQNL